VSRSYQKNPVCTDHKAGSTKRKKRLASKAFRKEIALDDEMAARPQHKKYFQSYDICDFKTRMTEQEAIDWYLHRCDNKYILKHYPTLEAWMKYWKKCYRSK